MTNSTNSTSSGNGSPAEHYDLIIVGTGSGNSLPTPGLEEKKIAIVERGVFGGTCINVGCIPTKMFVYAADVAREVAEAQRLSLTGEITNVDWKDIQRRVFGERIDPISEGGEEYRRGAETPNITLYKGTASFTGTRRLQIEPTSGEEAVTITGDQIVLATGTRPFIPDTIADSGVKYHTNDTIMRLEELPKSLTILGGGIIAVEFAHVFSALGTDVTVINRSPRLLKNLDETLVERFNSTAQSQWHNILGRTFTGAREDQDGNVVVELDDGSSVTSEHLLVALGRVPNSDLLNLQAGGVETTEKGYLSVDEFGQTSADGVWALGDASNEFQLKHVANAEARVVNHNLLHAFGLKEERKRFNHSYVPSGIFTHPQIATVGMTEAEAQRYAEESGHKITVKVQDYSDVAYGWAMEDQVGFCKLIADADTGRLVGAHLMGAQATTLIQQLITAMVFDIDARLLAKNQYWPHPALSEVVENALLGLEFNGTDPKEMQP